MSMAEAVGSSGGGSGSEESVGGGVRAPPLAICTDVLERLVAGGHVEEASRSDSLAALQDHFAQLPISYHLYVGAGEAEYVLIHQKILAEAKADRSRPAFHAHYLRSEELYMDTATTSGAREEGDDAGDALLTRIWRLRTQIHEIVFSSIDKPRLLNKLSTLLSENGMNIREAHVFSTKDGYSIDVFVVDGWPVEILFALLKCDDNFAWYGQLGQETGGLHRALEYSISRNMVSLLGLESLSLQPFSAEDCVSDIDRTLLRLIRKLASGSCGDTFLATYGGELVSVKVLRSADVTQILWKEFKQEILMLREVDHANIIRLIGSCTKPPQFYIITEYMTGGSLFDFLQNTYNVLDLPKILKFALDICRGMAYLHQKGIIHRDLKSANLLLDKYHDVKVADFGLSRYQDQEGVMTAETGTYRWMAPEVMKHQQYGPAADVYSFAIVLWELMTSKRPYDTMNPIQAAVNVCEGMRPQLPENAHPRLLTLMQRCWDASPSERPPFSDAIAELEDIQAEAQGATSGQTSQGEERLTKARKLDSSDPTV